MGTNARVQTRKVPSVRSLCGCKLFDYHSRNECTAFHLDMTLSAKKLHATERQKLTRCQLGRMFYSTSSAFQLIIYRQDLRFFCVGLNRWSGGYKLNTYRSVLFDSLKKPPRIGEITYEVWAFMSHTLNIVWKRKFSIIFFLFLNTQRRIERRSQLIKMCGNRGWNIASQLCKRTNCFVYWLEAPCHFIAHSGRSSKAH